MYYWLISTYTYHSIQSLLFPPFSCYKIQTINNLKFICELKQWNNFAHCSLNFPWMLLSSVNRISMNCILRYQGTFPGASAGFEFIGGMNFIKDAEVSKGAIWHSSRWGQSKTKYCIWWNQKKKIKIL